MRSSRLAYAKIALASTLLSVISPRAFPCSPPEQRLLDFVSSAWDFRNDGEILRVGPQPVFFAQSANDLPSTLTLDGAEVAMDYTLLRKPELEQDGMLAFVPRAPLTPGRYCTYLSCVDVEATFDNSSVTASTAIRGGEERGGGAGCMDAGDCGGWALPRAIEVTTRLSPGQGARLATWRIILGNAPGQISYPLAVLFGRGTSWDPNEDILAIVDGQHPVSLKGFKQFCVMLQPILWDGTVLAPVDGGCFSFEKTLED